MSDRLITREGVELELEDRELEETAIPFRLREVLEEFAEATTWRRKQEEWLSRDSFAIFHPEEQARKVRENYRAIHTEAGLAYKMAKARARFNAWAKRRRREDPDWLERGRAKCRDWQNKKRQTDPAWTARRNAARKEWRKRLRADPIRLAKHQAQQRASAKRRREDPAWRNRKNSQNREHWKATGWKRNARRRAVRATGAKP